MFYAKFEYPLDLHCSQTTNQLMAQFISLNTLWIYTALKLSCTSVFTSESLNTLWIYTALKQVCRRRYIVAVWIPSGFTLLSNYSSDLWKIRLVWIPSGFTLLSNIGLYCRLKVAVWIPSGFTLLSNKHQRKRVWSRFEYPLDLHCSQTRSHSQNAEVGLNTLWIYTALKL